MRGERSNPNRAKDRRLRVIAKYDFQPNEPEELAFRKGDVITVLEQVGYSYSYLLQQHTLLHIHTHTHTLSLSLSHTTHTAHNRRY